MPVMQTPPFTRHTYSAVAPPLSLHDALPISAASDVLIVTRTSSEPASASARTCATVAATSAVSVFVIDCTTIGAPPPTATPPMSTRRLARRSMCGRSITSMSFERDARDASARVRCQIERLAAEGHVDLGRIAERQLERRQGG